MRPLGYVTLTDVSRPWVAYTGGWLSKLAEIFGSPPAPVAQASLT